MQEKIIEELRHELKEQIKENQELNDSITWWKNRYEAQVKINEEHKKLNGELRKENDALITVIDLAKHFIKKYETIRGYYEYEECGYDEYNYEDDLKQELLEILERVNEE